MCDRFTYGCGAAVKLGRTVPHQITVPRIFTPAGDALEARGCKQGRTQNTDTGQQIYCKLNTLVCVCYGSYLLAAARR